MVSGAEKEPNGHEDGDGRQEESRREFDGRPQIVDAPTKGFWRVFVEQKTGDEPDGENGPGIPELFLKLPDKPGDVSAEGERLDEREVAWSSGGG